MQAEYFGHKYKSASKGNYDVYVVFIERALSIINKNGEVGFILPHKFFNAQYGSSIRNLLVENKAVNQIVHFGHQQIFENATTYTCIIILDKIDKPSFDLIKVENLETWKDSDKKIDGKIEFENLKDKDWNFVTGKTQKIFDRLASLPNKLENVTDRIFQGLKTSADKIFIVKKVEETESNYVIYCPQNEKIYTVEKSLLHPLIKGGDSRGFIFSNTELLIIFPYKNSSLISEAEIKENFPLTYSYLKDHKRYLENRENGKMKTAKWYGYVYPKSLDIISTPKIFTPDISPNASYAIDKVGDIFFTGGVSGGYGIKVKKEISELYILALLNSKLLDWYLKQISTQMRGGWYSFEAKFIKNIPIILSDADSKFHDSIVHSVETMLQLQKEKQQTNLPDKLN